MTEQQEEPRTGIVPTAEPEKEALVPWVGGQQRVAVYSTLPPEETLNLMVTAGRIREHLREVLKVTDIIVHLATVIDQDGDAIPGKRTILVCKDGSAYAGMADGVLGSLEMIVAAYGPPPWVDGLELAVLPIETRRGFTTFRLVPPLKEKDKKKK